MADNLWNNVAPLRFYMLWGSNNTAGPTLDSHRISGSDEFLPAIEIVRKAFGSWNMSAIDAEIVAARSSASFSTRNSRTDVFIIAFLPHANRFYFVTASNILDMFEIRSSPAYFFMPCPIQAHPAHMCAMLRGMLQKLVPSFDVSWRNEPQQSQFYALTALFFDIALEYAPQEITADLILTCPLAELQRRAIEVYGADRLVESGTLLDEAIFNGKVYRLWVIPTSGHRFENIRFLEVPDASTPRRYFLRVPDFGAAIDALAWTFNMTPTEYAELEIET